MTIDGFSYWDLLLLLAGGIISLLLNQFFNRRGTFKFQTFYNQIGLTANDNVFGNVEVKWNHKVYDALWLARIEIVNDSSKDYKDVEVKLYGGEGNFLLTEKSHIDGTIDFVDYTENFKSKISIHKAASDAEKIDAEIFYTQQRHYQLSVFNRNQKVVFEILLNVSRQEHLNAAPFVGVSVLHEGVQSKQVFEQPAPREIWGIPVSEAAILGTLISALSLVIITNYLGANLYTLIFAFVIGLIAQIPGALFAKIIRLLNSLIRG